MYNCSSLQWRHNEQESVSNHQPHNCLLNCLFRPGSNKTSKLRVTGLCVGNSPGTGEFPAEMASNAEMFPFDDVIMFNCFIVDGLPWCHHASGIYLVNKSQCAIHGIRPFTTTCGRCRTDFGTLWHVYRVRFHRAVKRPSFLMAWCQNGARAFLNFPRWHGWTRNQTSSSLISHPYMYYDIRYYFWKLLCRHLLPLCCQLLLVDICAGKYVWWVMIYGDMPR